MCVVMSNEFYGKMIRKKNYNKFDVMPQTSISSLYIVMIN